MQGRYHCLGDQLGMMQNLGGGWIIEQGNKVLVGFGSQHSWWQVVQGSSVVSC